MTYVVTEACIRCKYTDCVDVCPVDCFREGANFLVIDPDECIDCTLCVAECPVEAIYAEDDVPDDQQQFKAINAELSKLWKPIIERKPAPPDAEEWMRFEFPRQQRDRHLCLADFFRTREYAKQTGQVDVIEGLLGAGIPDVYGRIYGTTDTDGQRQVAWVNGTLQRMPDSVNGERVQLRAVRADGRQLSGQLTSGTWMRWDC